MAFDLVHYFTEQIKSQKPQLLAEQVHPARCESIHQLNCLCLGQLIVLWRQAPDALYAEISQQDPLYVQQLARQLTTGSHAHFTLSMSTLETSLTTILTLQLAELKQLDDTAHFGLSGMGELLNGQIEHLSGQAVDWVWQCNGLTELIGSKASEPEAEISLTATIKEFHQMVQQHDTHPTPSTFETPLEVATPTWAKIAAPLVALATLAYLWNWYSFLSSI